MSTATVADPTAERFAFATTSDLAALQPRWTELAARSDNVFATYEWLATWWRHFGRDRPLHLTTVHDGDELVAILPLYLATTRPGRVLRFLGHGATDQLGPICAVADRDRSRRALHQFLHGPASPRWDLVIADELPAAASPQPGARLLDRSPTHVVALASQGVTADGWSATRPPKLRAQLSRDGRRLDQLGAVRHRTTDDPDAVDRDLDVLFELHRRRWEPAGGSRSFAGREAFHRDVARTFLRQDRLRLRFLELDGRAIAATYSFRFDGVESNYQSGRDPAFDRCSVGLLVHRHAIRDCADEGVGEYRFLRGDEPYKQRLADHTVEQESIAWARGPVGGATLAAVAQMPRLSRTRARWVPASLAWGTGGSPRWGAP